MLTKSKQLQILGNLKKQINLPFEDVEKNVDLLARLKKEYFEASDLPIGTIPDHGPTNIDSILKNTFFFRK